MVTSCDIYETRNWHLVVLYLRTISNAGLFSGCYNKPNNQLLCIPFLGCKNLYSYQSIYSHIIAYHRDEAAHRLTVYHTIHSFPPSHCVLSACYIIIPQPQNSHETLLVHSFKYPYAFELHTRIHLVSRIGGLPAYLPTFLVGGIVAHSFTLTLPLTFFTTQAN